jgi:hypothetical protein
MDNEIEITELELELRRLRPLEPSARLRTSLGQQLKAKRHGTLVRLSWLVVPMAAGLAIFLNTPPSHDRTIPQPTTSAMVDPRAATPFKLIAAENILLDSRDEGLVTLADGTPARRLRESYVATLVWKNPRTDASFKWTVPREEFRVVPVSFQ